MIPTIFALMCVGKSHAQECIFHRPRHWRNLPQLMEVFPQTFYPYYHSPWKIWKPSYAPLLTVYMKYKYSIQYIN